MWVIGLLYWMYVCVFMCVVMVSIARDNVNNMNIIYTKSLYRHPDPPLRSQFLNIINMTFDMKKYVNNMYLKFQTNIFPKNEQNMFHLGSIKMLKKLPKKLTYTINMLNSKEKTQNGDLKWGSLD